MFHINLTDILGKISGNVDKLAQWANKDNNEYLDSQEWSIFMDKAAEAKKTGKLSEDKFQKLMGLEIDEKNRIDSPEFSDDELEGKREELNKIKPFYIEYGAKTGSETESYMNQKLILEVAERLDEVKDAAVQRDVEDSKEYVKNKTARESRAKVAAANPAIQGVTGMSAEDVSAKVKEGLESKLNEHIVVDDNGKLTFTFKTKDGKKATTVTKSIDLTKLANLKRPFDLKKITELVKNLAKASGEAQDSLNEIQKLIDERNKAIEENNTQIQQRIETITSVEKQFKSSLTVEDDTYNEVVKEIQNGTPVEKLTKEEQIIYYQRQLKTALGDNEVPFNVTEEKDKDGVVTGRKYELDLTGDAKDAYDKLNTLAPHLGLKEKAIALKEAKETRDKLQIGSIVAQQEIAELTFAQNEITKVKTMVDEDLAVMQKHKKSMENGETFIAEAQKADKQDVKVETRRNKASSNKTAKENKKYTDKAKEVSGTIETNENQNIYDGATETKGTKQGQTSLEKTQNKEATVDKKETRSTSYTQAISKHNSYERRANDAINHYNDEHLKSQKK